MTINMADNLSPEERRKHMQKIRSKDTQPELFVRRILHALGYRYRTHVAEIPGSPDIVFTKRRKIIYIHGCFWHAHASCKLSHIPKTRSDYWRKKLAKNAERDSRNIEAATKLGWECLILWECELSDRDEVQKRLIEFLG